jgi:hypothetical protein
MVYLLCSNGLYILRRRRLQGLLLFGWQGGSWGDGLKQVKETYCTLKEHLGHVFELVVGISVERSKLDSLPVSNVELLDT